MKCLNLYAKNVRCVLEINHLFYHSGEGNERTMTANKNSKLLYLQSYLHDKGSVRA